MDDSRIPEVFQTASGLGALLGYYPVRRSHRLGNLVVCLVLLAGAALVLLYGIYSSFLAYQLHGPAVIDNKLTASLLIAVLLAGLGALAGWGAYANWRKGAAVYERGLAYQDRTGLKTWSWEDILSMTSAVTRHYTNGIYTGTSHVYNLLGRHNQKVKLGDSIGKVESLARVIDTNIFPLLYPRAVEHYNSGEMLPFGPVAISKQGITIGKRTYPWGEVKEVSIHRGILKVTRKDGGWFGGARAPAAAIPNLRVLLAIIQQVVGLKAN